LVTYPAPLRCERATVAGLLTAVSAAARTGCGALGGKAPDNRHEKGNERVLHRKTKQVTMAPSHASATREGAAKR
jgi:hypothetical protein